MKIRAVDLFCGAGGASTGFVRACDELGVDYELLAINHWTTAIATHSANHPNVRHLCESVEKVDPREQVPGGRLHLLMAGPECTHFSTARGGRPVNPQSRASAWHVLKWAQELYIDTILIENVPEFRTWGPVGANGKPLRSMKGQTYRAFLDALRSLGYKVDDQVLNAADYGDPTTRQRLFIIARRGRGASNLSWPMPTHSKHGTRNLFGKTKRWVPAKEVIDWSLEGRSVFNRKTPLSPNTMARIIAGLEKFGGEQMKPFVAALRNGTKSMKCYTVFPDQSDGGPPVSEPFIVPVNHGAGDVRTNSIHEPLPTLTARANQYLVEPEITPFVLSQQSGGAPRATTDPLPTIATDGAIAVVEPFLMPPLRFDPTRTESVDDPLPTITATGGRLFGLAQPFLVPLYMERPGQTPRTHSVDDPVPTIPATGGGKFGVVEPFIVDANFGGHGDDSRVKSVDEPLGTLPGSNRYAIAEPFIVANNTNNAPKSTDEPVPAVTGGNRNYLVEPFVTKYYGTAKSAQSVDEPLDTITATDRFGLVQPVINGYKLDIRFRMLQLHELSAAMSFPKGYIFKGTREDGVKQVGNAWPGKLSKALCKNIVRDYASKRRLPREDVAWCLRFVFKNRSGRSLFS